MAGGEVGEQRDRALERGGEVEQAIERLRRPGFAERDRREPPAGELLQGARQSRGGRAGHGGVLDERQRQSVVAPTCLVERQDRRVGVHPDHTPGGKRHGVLVDRLVSCGHPRDAGGMQRERAAERAAQVVALGQLAGVDAQQLPRAGEQSHLQ